MISFRRLLLTALTIATITGASVWTTAATPTSAAATAKTAGLQADDQNKAKLDQLDQATDQDQLVEDEQDNEQDDSFFGKPGSTERWCWYIGGGVVIIAGAVALYYYFKPDPAQNRAVNLHIQWHDNGLLTEDEKQALAQEISTFVHNQPNPNYPRSNELENVIEQFLNQRQKQRPSGLGLCAITITKNRLTSWRSCGSTDISNEIYGTERFLCLRSDGSF